MADQNKIENKINEFSENVVQEMEEATREFIEERGKSVPERRNATQKTVESDKPVEPNEQSKIDNDTDEQSNNENNYTEEERMAMLKGWKPQDQYAGDPKDFRSAREFLGRSELYDKMSNQSKTIKEMQEAMRTLTEMNRRQHEMIHKDRLEYYQQQKKAAIEIASPNDVEKYEKAIQDEQKELDMYKPVQDNKDVSKSAPKITEVVKDFVSKNPWIMGKSEEDCRMRRYAIAFETELANSRPELSEEERLLETEREVKKVFSHNFENRNRARAPSVNIAPNENVSLKKTVKKKHSFDSLPSDVKQQVRLMAKYTSHNGKEGISLDDYAQQLYDTGVLKDE